MEAACKAAGVSGTPVVFFAVFLVNFGKRLGEAAKPKAVWGLAMGLSSTLVCEDRLWVAVTIRRTSCGPACPLL